MDATDMVRGSFCVGVQDMPCHEGLCSGKLSLISVPIVQKPRTHDMISPERLSCLRCAAHFVVPFHAHYFFSSCSGIGGMQPSSTWIFPTLEF